MNSQADNIAQEPPVTQPTGASIPEIHGGYLHKYYERTREPYCRPEDKKIYNACVWARRQGAPLRSKFTTIASAFNDTQRQWACDLSRESFTASTEQVDERYTLLLISKSGLWNTPSAFIANIETYLETGILLPAYKFVRTAFQRSSKNPGCFIAVFACASDQQLKNETGFGCNGRLIIRCFPRRRVVDFRHIHKHHTFKNDEPAFLPTSPSIQEVVKVVTTKWQINPDRRSAVNLLCRMLPRYSRKVIKSAYDDQIRDMFLVGDESRSDWKSLHSFFYLQPRHYAPYVFYEGQRMGLAVIFTKIVATLPKQVDSVAIYTKHGISKQDCQIVAAIANVGNLAIPIGYILIKKRCRVSEEIEGHYGWGSHDGIRQGPVGRAIGNIAYRKFRTNTKSALIAAFLILLYGSDRILYSDTIGCFTIKSKALQSRGIFSDPYSLNIRRLRRRPFDIKEKKVRGVGIPLITCEKNPVLMEAIQYVFPATPIKFCFWHVMESLKSTIDKTISGKPLNEFFDSTNFPDFLQKLCPPLFDKTPHSINECPHTYSEDTLVYSFKCRQCHPEFYEEMPSTRIPVPKSTKGSDYPEGDYFSECTLTKLANMMLDHSRTIAMLPQSFQYLGEITNVSENAMYYSSETLHQHILGDMLAFCLKYDLVGLFPYLWENWYNDNWLNRWTQYYCPRYTVPTTNMASKAFKNIFKNNMGRKRFPLFLADLARRFGTKAYPKYMKALRRFAKGRGMVAKRSKYRTQSWLKRRSLLATQLAKFSPLNSNDVSQEMYESDCQKYGTDVVLFVCGCHFYKKHNVHLCEHIARGLTRSSLAVISDSRRARNVLARDSPPFFVSKTPELLLTSPRTVWPKLTFNPAYLDFWKTKGRRIIASKGGRVARVMLPSPMAAPLKKALSGYVKSTAPALTGYKPKSQENESRGPANETVFSGVQANASRIIESCMACIQQSYHQNPEMLPEPFDAAKFLIFAIGVLKFEFGNLLNNLSVVSEDSTQQQTTTQTDNAFISILPAGERREFIRKAQQLGVFGNAISRNLVPKYVSRLSHNYTRLFADTMV